MSSPSNWNKPYTFIKILMKFVVWFQRLACTNTHSHDFLKEDSRYRKLLYYPLIAPDRDKLVNDPKLSRSGAVLIRDL